jgi:hypothetical protein
MSTLGKCVRCGKTAYSIEGFKVGPPNAEQVYHKGCFKCTALVFGPPPLLTNNVF